MRVLFCTSKLPGAALIRAVTWSDWSHVAIVDGEDVIEATWPAVRVAPLAEVIAKHSRHILVDLPCDPFIQNRPNFKPGYCFVTVTNPDGSSYWHLYWVKRINDQYCFNVNLGWKLKTYAEDPTRLKTESRAMFSFSPRIAGYSVQP